MDVHSSIHPVIIQRTVFIYYVLILCGLWDHKHEQCSGSALQEPVRDEASQQTGQQQDLMRTIVESYKRVWDFSGSDSPSLPLGSCHEDSCVRVCIWGFPGISVGVEAEETTEARADREGPSKHVSLPADVLPSPCSPWG